jgi:hypothetical protein
MNHGRNHNPCVGGSSPSSATTDPHQPVLKSRLVPATRVTASASPGRRRSGSRAACVRSTARPVIRRPGRAVDGIVIWRVSAPPRGAPGCARRRFRSRPTAHRLPWRAPPLLESCEHSWSLPLVSPVLPPNLMSPWSIVCALVHTGVSPFITPMRDRRRGFRACRRRCRCIPIEPSAPRRERSQTVAFARSPRARDARVRSAGLPCQAESPADRVNPRY